MVEKPEKWDILKFSDFDKFFSHISILLHIHRHRHQYSDWFLYFNVRTILKCYFFYPYTFFVAQNEQNITPTPTKTPKIGRNLIYFLSKMVLKSKSIVYFIVLTNLYKNIPYKCSLKRFHWLYGQKTWKMGNFSISDFPKNIHFYCRSAAECQFTPSDMI